MRRLPLALRASLLGASATAIACGGGSSRTPDAPSSPTPAVDTFTVSGIVYFDENGNSVIDAPETIRFGEVEVEIAGQTGVSAADTGRVSVAGVPAGSYQVGIRLPSLPPFFVPGAAPSVTSPSSAPVPIPVAFPMGSNNPFEYLDSGDSISQGEGAPEGHGYRLVLRNKLSAYYRRAVSSVYRGGGGGTSADGAARIGRDLQLVRPSHTLITWGTNDWNVCSDPSSCGTVPNLRAMVRSVKAIGSFPIVESILPPNVGYDLRVPEARRIWVAQENTLIRAMANEEGALYVDTYSAFMRQPNLRALFADHIHPNEVGHQLMANTFFDALTRPRSASASAASED
jgi:lysophospholipase L1-like esterase